MTSHFKTDACQMRAAYLRSLLDAWFQSAVRGANALRACFKAPMEPMGQRRIAASSWGKL
ncbi:hypothetical protein WG902_13180 [Ramlibacter sp. PS3R-8]|uniref:hypothetical protein n=1 Tax=Ramlibacter sp. PS3R-8 TaxID=3133437 RepID=UPI0030ABCD5D